jgi:peptidyl-dipeptidase A
VSVRPWFRSILGVLVSGLVGLAACGGGSETARLSACPPVSSPTGRPPAGRPSGVGDAETRNAPTVESATVFVADVERHLRTLWEARDRGNWINENFLTDDTDALATQGEQDTAAYLRLVIEQSKAFAPIAAELPEPVARKLYLLSIAQTIPAPSEPSDGRELAALETSMTSAYGKGTYCPAAGSALLKYASDPCLNLQQLSRVLATSRRTPELVEAWRGWHSIGRSMRAKYSRYVELANRGAREIGFADVGALWRSGYDMPPAQLEADVERLWADVKPLYDQLHCFVRAKLAARYGAEKVPEGGPIPAELLGNMWAQEWNNIFDLVVPYPREAPVDVTRALQAKHWDALKMVHQGEQFFIGLGFDPLPATFWQRSLFTRPRDREVVCHASAWDVSWSGDLRVKMCIEPTEEDFVTIHHELGHDFYFQRYESLPILFEQGANDGFHEAIGDTMALSVTPEYLANIGLSGSSPGPSSSPSTTDDHVRINQQMKMALDKVAFLPFGLLIDKWRWEVFSGKVSPSEYDDAWWKLARQYQGVRSPSPITEEDFDPGAKFHVASSTPYLRYFLARIYQFQFHKALCAAAGHAGPLDTCSIRGSREAGARLMAMLSLGASRPWPEALDAIGAGRKADAEPLLEYFKPLSQWLSDQNKGRKCGW